MLTYDNFSKIQVEKQHTNSLYLKYKYLITRKNAQNAHCFPESRGGNFKLPWSPEIDSKELILPAYVVWRVGTRTLFLLVSWPPYIVQKFQHRSQFLTRNQNHLFAHEGHFFPSETHKKRLEYDNFGLFLWPSIIALSKNHRFTFKSVDFLSKNYRYVCLEISCIYRHFILKKVDIDKINEDNNVGKFVLMIVAPLYF
jgi:hypothetical protein